MTSHTGDAITGGGALHYRTTSRPSDSNGRKKLLQSVRAQQVLGRGEFGAVHDKLAIMSDPRSDLGSGLREVYLRIIAEYRPILLQYCGLEKIKAP